MALLTKAKHLLRGESAEQEACQYLIKQNLKLITRNYRCKFGEIDIVMKDKQTLVFAEVRFRKNSHFGDGAESITTSKQSKLIKTAQYYLQQHPEYSQLACRFDVLSMAPSTTNSKIDWIKDAFQA